MFVRKTLDPIIYFFVFIPLLGPTVGCSECEVEDPLNPSLCSYCPQTEYEIQTPRASTQCYCLNNDTLKCSPTHNLNQIFDVMVNQLHHRNRYFKSILVQECNSDQIPTNFFCGLNFQTIQIRDCKNLKSFSAHAFSGTADFLETLDLDIYSSSAELWSNIFHGINHLPALKNLKITGFQSLIIPPNTFKALISSVLFISNILFNDGLDRDNSIESIANQAFNNLPYLENLDISNVRIGSIEDYAFKSDRKTNNNLVITLTAEDIADTKFTESSFCGTNRTIILKIKGSGNSMKLETNYWKNFLDENENNLIQFFYFTLDCDQDFIKNLNWIKTNVDRYRKQIDAICYTGTVKLVDKVAGTQPTQPTSLPI